MRRTHAFLATLVLATAPVLAQTPPDLQPLPAVPPPPPEMAPLDASLEPQVTIVQRDGDLWLLLPRGLVGPLLERLRRYVLRAKVQLRDASGLTSPTTPHTP